MKNLFILALLAIGLSSLAQDRTQRPNRGEIEQMTAEQRNQLLVKKMTLELDLNATQQEQISKVVAEQRAKRDAFRAEQKNTAGEEKKNRFEMKNKMLDEQIEMKNTLKRILSAEQLAKWEALKDKKRTQIDERRQNRKAEKQD